MKVETSFLDQGFCGSVAGTFSLLYSRLVAGVDLEVLVCRLLVLARDLDVITLNDVVLLEFLLGCPQNGLLRSSKQLVRRFLELAGTSSDFSPLAFFLSLGLRARQLSTKRILSLVTSLFA